MFARSKRTHVINISSNDWRNIPVHAESPPIKSLTEHRSSTCGILWLMVLIFLIIPIDISISEEEKVPQQFEHGLVSWRIPFQGSLRQAVIGQNVAYYLTSSSHPPGGREEDVRESITVHKNRTGWELLLVCVDLKSGSIRWSRKVRSRSWITVDPKNDNCHVYDLRWITLSAEDGSVRRKSDVLTGDTMEGILFDSGPVVSGNRNQKFEPGHQWKLIDAQNEMVIEQDVIKLQMLSPDEKYRLRFGPAEEGKRALTCVTADEGKKQWTYEREVAPPVLQTPIPRWHNNRVYWLNGATERKTELVCIDGDSGELVWRHTLSSGLYDSDSHPHTDNSYDLKWAPMSIQGDRILLSETTGQIKILNTFTGDVKAKLTPSRAYTSPPKIVNDHLVVFTPNEARAYPLPLGRDSPKRKKLLKRIDQHMKDGSLDRALKLSGRAIKHDHDFSDAYQRASDVLRKMDRERDALYFRARALELSGGGSDPLLRKRLGLIRILSLGSPVGDRLLHRPKWVLNPDEKWRMKFHRGNWVFAGTQDGRLVGININSLETKTIERTSNEISDIHENREIFLQDHSSRKTFHRFSLPLLNVPTSDAVPDKWYMITGRSGNVRYEDGTYYRTKENGRLEVWNPEQESYEVRKPKIDVQKKWEIARIPGDEIGYGHSGIFELDQKRRPSAWIFQSGDGWVEGLRLSRGHMGCIFQTDDNERQLRIFNREGELLRKIPTRGRSFLGGFDQFRKWGGGYLLSARDWLWVHPDPEVPIRNLAPPTGDLRSMDLWWSGRRDWLGIPLQVGNKFFVPTRHGSIYVFDAAFPLHAVTEKSTK